MFLANVGPHAHPHGLEIVLYVLLFVAMLGMAAAIYARSRG